MSDISSTGIGTVPGAYGKTCRKSQKGLHHADFRVWISRHARGGSGVSSPA